MNERIQREHPDAGLLLEVITNGSRSPSVILVAGDTPIATDVFRPASARNRKQFLNSLPTDFAEGYRAWVDAMLQDVAGELEREANTPERSGPVVVLPEPWDTSVQGSALLAELVSTVRRFVILTEPQAVAVALWIVATYIVDRAEVATRLAIESPTKSCGKTRLLEVLGALVRDGLPAANISAAALFRVVDRRRPTVLVDEADTFLARADEVKGLLNAGHSRTNSKVYRCEGDDNKAVEFDVFTFVALAMIGTLHDTLASRSIRIRMRRKVKGESVERWRVGRHPEELQPLCRRIRRWTEDHGLTLANSDPRMSEALTDRDEDNWRLLVAIADHAGESWGNRARSVALELSGLPVDDTEDWGVLLLEDIRALFAERDVDWIETAAMVQHLAGLDERPWPDIRGKPITGRRIAKLLRRFDVRGHRTRNARGYQRDDFVTAWAQYCTTGPVPPPPSDTSVIALQGNDLGLTQDDLPQTPAVTRNSLQHNAVADVTLPHGGTRGIPTNRQDSLPANHMTAGDEERLERLALQAESHGEDSAGPVHLDDGPAPLGDPPPDPDPDPDPAPEPGQKGDGGPGLQLVEDDYWHALKDGAA